MASMIAFGPGLRAALALTVTAAAALSVHQMTTRPRVRAEPWRRRKERRGKSSKGSMSSLADSTTSRGKESAWVMEWSAE